MLAEKLGLETIQVGLDPATNALESTLITREYVNTRWGGLRLGMTAGFSVPQTWEMWTDYRLPDIRPFNAFSLRYFSLNANIDNYNEREFNLQWRREF
ncbi:MAG: hypothetical protein BWY76_01208 [bacterium ADurb.Bin429]|nr:MAG: hypothetical protein BWY76_01208 [bacterium ADurb.Bin429]